MRKKKVDFVREQSEPSVSFVFKVKDVCNSLTKSNSDEETEGERTRKKRKKKRHNKPPKSS